MTTMRLIPALALTAFLALGFKISGVADGAFPGVFDAYAAAEAKDQPAPEPHSADAPAAAAAPPEAAKPDGPAAAPAAEVRTAAALPEAASSGEADVLRSLALRREALAQRERDLSIREQTLAVAERRVEERVAELKAIEARINAALGQREAQHQAQIDGLVKMYESMKPGDAAKIFEKMDRPILIAVTSKMKPAKLGSALALMDPGKAQDLTVALANRLNPENILGQGPAEPPAAAAAQPAGVAPAPVAPPPAAPPVLTPDVLPQPKAEAGPASNGAAPGPAPAAATPAPPPGAVPAQTAPVQPVPAVPAADGTKS